MIGWREYQAGDIAAINCAEPDPYEGWAQHVEATTFGKATITLSGKPIAAFGGVELWPGVLEAFAVVDRDSSKGHGRIVAAMFKARIEQAMAALNYHRAQATVCAGDRAGEVFLRAIGFRLEATLRMGSPDGSDLKLYALLRPRK